MNTRSARMVRAGLLVGAVGLVGCAPAPPQSAPAVVRIESPTQQKVRITVTPSTTQGVWAYRFTLRPPAGSVHAPLLFDQPTPELLIDPTSLLPRDGTPYEVVAQALKDNKESEVTAVGANRIAVVDRIIPGTPGTPGATPAQVAAAEDQIRQEIMDATNAERVARGMTPLARHAGLEAFQTLVTDRHSAAGTCLTPRLFMPGFFTCHSTDADQYAFRDANTPFTNVGENSNEGPVYFPVNSVVGWMRSPGHRAAILDRTPTHIGIGVSCDSSGGAWMLQGFGASNALDNSPAPVPAGNVEPPLIVTPEWGFLLNTPYPKTVCPSVVGTPAVPDRIVTTVNVG